MPSAPARLTLQCANLAVGSRAPRHQAARLTRGVPLALVVVLRAAIVVDAIQSVAFSTLIEAGADATLTNIGGRTARQQTDWLLRGGSNAYPEVGMDDDDTNFRFEIDSDVASVADLLDLPGQYPVEPARS